MTKKTKVAPPAERQMWTVQEFCAAYRLGPTTFYKLKATGKLRTVMIGGRRLVPVDAAKALMNGAN